MQHIFVNHPEEFGFPLSRDVFEDRHIVFHGTGSKYAERIQSASLRNNHLPYDWHDIRIVAGVARKMALEFSEHEHWPVLNAFTLGAGDSYVGDKPISFDVSYWRARNYASIKDSETVTALRGCAEHLLRLCSSPAAQANHLQIAIGQATPSVQARVQAFLNGEGLAAAQSQLKQVLRKYAPDSQTAVVLVIEAESDQLEDHGTVFRGAARIKTGDMGIELRLRNHMHIRPTQIRARIDFPNGTRPWFPFTNMPLPLPWEGIPGRLQEIDDQDLRRKYERCF
jgi:hypothetical protein